MKSVPYSTIQEGTFLIATPGIETGLFFRSVVLIVEHSQQGTFGLIINKPLKVELPQEIINIASLANPFVELRAGGPLQTNQLLLLHTASSYENQQMLELCKGVSLGGDLAFLQQAMADEHGPRLLLCFGYASWGAGQAEREFLDGSWLLHPATEQHVFDIPAEQLWQSLLRQMGGKYASLSLIPEDLSVN